MSPVMATVEAVISSDNNVPVIVALPAIVTSSGRPIVNVLVELS
jgi:hypothetical protein